jgi:XTP/dITP diphosphohydrolase
LFGRAGIPVVDLEEVGLRPDPLEDDIEKGATFEENAIAKARYFFERLQRPVVADDSGLEVRALGNQPGVRSRRWSGRSDLVGQALDDANNSRLLSELARQADRGARYVCVATYVAGDMEVSRRGETEGLILEAPRGDHGFGYDPYFFSLELGKTFGQASGREKEAVSHRGRAFRELLAALRHRR